MPGLPEPCFPLLPVRLPGEAAAGARRLELQPRDQVHPVLLLQERGPLHHRGEPARPRPGERGLLQGVLGASGHFKAGFGSREN